MAVEMDNVYVSVSVATCSHYWSLDCQNDHNILFLSNIHSYGVEEMMSKFLLFLEAPLLSEVLGG